MSMQNISYFVLTCLTVLIGISLATSPTQSSLSTDLTTSGPRENCIKVSSCKCSYADGTVIDLTPLSKTDGTAYFSNITSNRGVVFSWNPCNPFSYPKGKTTSTCGNVAVCMQISIASLDVMISLGKQNSAMFTKDEGGMHLSYASTQGGHVYVANIILRCNRTLQNSVFDVDTYSPPYLTNTTSIYSSILNSKYACSSLPMTKTSPSTSTKTTITSKRPSGSTDSTRTLVHTTNTQSRNAATSPIKHVYNLVLHCLAMLITLSWKRFVKLA